MKVIIMNKTAINFDTNEFDDITENVDYSQQQFIGEFFEENS